MEPSERLACSFRIQRIVFQENMFLQCEQLCFLDLLLSWGQYVMVQFVAEAKKESLQKKFKLDLSYVPPFLIRMQPVMLIDSWTNAAFDFAERNYGTWTESIVRSCFVEINWRNYLFFNFVVNIPKLHWSYGTPLSLHCWSSKDRKVFLQCTLLTLQVHF